MLPFGEESIFALKAKMVFINELFSDRRTKSHSLLVLQRECAQQIVWTIDFRYMDDVSIWNTYFFSKIFSYSIMATAAILNRDRPTTQEYSALVCAKI